MENDLLEITEIPESVWANLRPALEQAALLTAEHVHDNVIDPFLHFHPVLVPYLRSQSKEEDVALSERYAQQYYAAAEYCYQQDNQHPEPIRAIVRRELPNLRKVLELMLQDGDVDEAADMAERVIGFLNYFGLTREIEQVRRRVAKEMEVYAEVGVDGSMTNAEYLHKLGLAQDESKRGDIRTAYRRLMSLMARIEATPKGISRGQGSCQHCQILLELARCFKPNRQLQEAEETLRKALSIVDGLLRQDAENQDHINLRSSVLGELGDVLANQGKYRDAKEMYEQVLAALIDTNNVRGQAVALGQLGMLALMQRNFDEAQSSYFKALESFRALGEPAREAIAWHQLGVVAGEQRQWIEAERCYRKSLAIKEQSGDKVSAAMTCSQLVFVALCTGRPIEAEGWGKRAIQLEEQIQAGSVFHATYLNNLAGLLVSEVIAGHAPKTRLVEAHYYVEQAKLIWEQQGVSAEIWTTFYVLAQIADLEERTEEAQDYRRRERESFAAFAGNRYHIDRQYSALIAAIVVAARGDIEVRKSVEERLPKLEEAGSHISQAVQRIWAGERDWPTLVKGMDRGDALLILRALETLQQPSESEEEVSLEELVASLPAAMLEAMQRGDEVAYQQAFEALSEEEQERVGAILQALEEAQGEEDDEPS